MLNGGDNGVIMLILNLPLVAKIKKLMNIMSEDKFC